MAISYDMKSESRFAEKIRLGIDLIDQIVDRALAKNAIYSAEFAYYQLMDLQDFLASEDHDCRHDMSGIITTNLRCPGGAPREARARGGACGRAGARGL